jgi:predicted PurR-regulated permease PerM
MTVRKYAPQDLTRITLQILWIGILIAATFWIMRPFLPSLIWAAMIVAATWPLMRKVESWLWGKRGLAVTVMTVAMLFLFIVPFSLAIVAILENADKIMGWVNALKTQALPALPGWVEGIPVIGPKLAAAWQSLVAGPEGLSSRLAPYAGKIFSWFLSQAGSVGMIAIQFLLTVIIAAIFYAKGEVASTGVIRFARRLGGHRGEEVAILAAQTVRGVALGVVGTALIQSLLGGIGVAVCGVPAAAVLTAVMFILCIAQLGPALVLIPAIIWLYYTDQTTWGTVLLVWSIFVGTIDNFLRPLLIKMGADLPIFLIFAGVIGGLVTFGVVGLFIGPVVLAITYRLLAAWVDSSEEGSEQVPPEKD